MSRLQLTTLSGEVLEEMGEIICHQTNHGPGHHSSYAIVDGVPIVGISGPSGGASFTLNFYLLPVMKRFLGIDPAPQMIPACVVWDVPKLTLESTQKAISQVNRRCAHSVDLPTGFHPRLTEGEDRGVLYHDLSCPLESGFNPIGRYELISGQLLYAYICILTEAINS